MYKKFIYNEYFKVLLKNAKKLLTMLKNNDNICK